MGTGAAAAQTSQASFHYQRNKSSFRNYRPFNRGEPEGCSPSICASKPPFEGQQSNKEFKLSPPSCGEQVRMEELINPKDLKSFRPVEGELCPHDTSMSASNHEVTTKMFAPLIIQQDGRNLLTDQALPVFA